MAGRRRLARNLVGRPTGFVNRQPATIPQGAYRQQTSLETIPGGYAAGVITAAGSLTLLIGPSGVGSVWYPSMASLSTATGLTDASTAAVYISPQVDAGALVPATQVGGQTFSGGAAQVPLPGVAVYPGYFVICVWAGGHAGDQATLTVYGSSKVLT